MLSKITTFFQSLADVENNKESTISLEIACSVLLCEVMLADGKLDDSEKEKLKGIISSQFNITEDDVNEIIKHALLLCENSTDFYQFTSRINASYDLEQRIKIITLLWQIAYADGELASIEEHIIRKIADLLHLRHSEYIQTKLAVRENLREQ